MTAEQVSRKAAAATRRADRFRRAADGRLVELGFLVARGEVERLEYERRAARIEWHQVGLELAAVYWNLRAFSAWSLLQLRRRIGCVRE